MAFPGQAAVVAVDIDGSLAESMDHRHAGGNSDQVDA
jgi:hypothetical protein